MNILVSACLVGTCCRYDGGHNRINEVVLLGKHHTLIPVCPEQLGGLPTPRPAAEILNDSILTKEGFDVSKAFIKGAEETLKLAKFTNCSHAILKERSPSCGSKQIYNGHFSKTLIDGMGVTAKLLKENGIAVMGENDISLLAKKKS